MGLFTESLNKLFMYLQQTREKGRLQEHIHECPAAWPEKRSLVLQEDTAVELGSEKGSLFMIAWTQEGDLLHNGRVSILGEDIAGAGERKMPLGQIVLVCGQFADEYETYRDLLDVVFDTRPEGVSLRVWPDQQKIWCRVSKEALEGGFTLQGYGAALINNMTSQPFVEAAEVIFITGEEDLEQLKPLSDKVGSVLEALVKMYEEMDFDCDNCDYNEICEEVERLRQIRESLRKERDEA